MTIKKALCGNKRRYSILLLNAVVAVGLTACGQNQIRSDQPGFEASKPISVKYEVQRGDSLVKIAQQLTGDPENWAEIAAINDITKPKTMPIGMVLTIPDYLLPEMAQTKSVTFKPKTETEVAVEETEPTPAETIEEPVVVASKVEEAQPAPRKTRSRKDWIFQASSLPGQLEIPAVVHRAAANRTFNIERIDGEAAAQSNSGTFSTAAQSNDVSSAVNSKLVRVIGTYYPKGIYSQPSYTSNLLMRVAPGTQLELEQSFGDWLQIRTDKGSGYIRTIDAEILSSAVTDSLLLSTNG